MLESATVTMSYGELQGLIDTLKEYEARIGEIKDIQNMTEEDFEADPFRKALDTIFDLLEKASKLTKANEKQYFIYASMEMYCNTFGIPIKELLEDVPKGTESK